MDRRVNHKGPPGVPLNMMPNLNNSIPSGAELVSKRLIPLKRTSKSVNYVVGLISFEEYRGNREHQPIDESEVQEEPPKDIAPPYVLCMNFSQFKQDKTPEILDLSQDNKTNEAFLPGSLLDKENALLKAWMKKFWDYQARITPCCDHTRKFWEWVFLLWPDSKFKWNFKNLDRKWFEYMVSFPRFREALRKWLIENEDDVVKDLEKKAQYQNKAARMAQEIKTIISDLNDKLFCDLQEGRTTQEEPNQSELKSLIDNGGILVTYDPSTVTEPCEEEKCKKLVCNPDTSAPLLKNFNKTLKKRREKSKLDSPIFKYMIVEPKPKSDAQVSGEEKNGSDMVKIEARRIEKTNDSASEDQREG